jgi:hypothetical protein
VLAGGLEVLPRLFRSFRSGRRESGIWDGFSVHHPPLPAGLGIAAFVTVSDRLTNPRRLALRPGRACSSQGEFEARNNHNLRISAYDKMRRRDSEGGSGATGSQGDAR